MYLEKSLRWEIASFGASELLVVALSGHANPIPLSLLLGGNLIRIVCRQRGGFSHVAGTTSQR